MTKWLWLVLITLFTTNLAAQYCTPQANCQFRDYVDDFSINTLVNNNSQGSDCRGRAYVFNTTRTTTLTQGLRYNFSVRGRTFGTPQGFGIWIDYNADGDFNDPGEFVASNSTPTNQAFTGNITIPFTATVGTTRLRVRSYRGTAINASNSCTTFNAGETEDYTITIAATTLPPIANFKSNKTSSCDPTISFTDLSTQNPTSWLWEFGDGDTSTQQNPTHTYAGAGTYTVKLTASNTNGPNSKTETNYITIISGAKPIPASCSPTTASSSAGFGITSLKFAGINQSSSDATVGYEDFSCISGMVTRGGTYQLQFGSVSAPANQSFKAWLDYNNDGIFSSQELILDQPNTKEANKQITISATSITGKRVRLRVAAVFYLNAPSGNNYNACASLQNGQMEDYNILINPNTSAPKTNFEAVETTSCDGTVNFKDLSSNGPTTWFWDFGDGNTSTTKNPSHTYSASGTYTIKLRTGNSIGTDSLSKNNYVTVNLANAAKKACIPSTRNHIDDYGITSVKFNTISHTSADASEGYQDNSCNVTTEVDENKAYQMEVITGTLNKEDVTVWIDYDNNGIFDDLNEKVMTSFNNNSHTQNIVISASSIKNTRLRMRIASDIVGRNLKACDDPNYGQVEDYSITIKGDTTKPNGPIAEFEVDSTYNCIGTVQFLDKSTGNPTSWEWDFGDGNKSTDKNPRHTYSLNQRYTVSLKVTNGFGVDVETKNDYVEKDEKHCGPNSLLEINSKTIKVFPNPTDGKVTLSFNRNSVNNYDIKVYSIQGRVIYLNRVNTETDKDINIDLSSNESGIYFIQLDSSEGSVIKKILLN